MRKEKFVPKEGDIITVEFVKNQNKGKKPVAIHNGWICFIDRKYRGQFINEQSIWQVEITQVRASVLIIDPIQIVKSAAANKADKANDIEKLGNKFSKEQKKHVKRKTFFPYKSNQERV